jgi:cyanate permease
MRRVWTTVVAVWATLAIVAALAWTRQAPPRQLAQPAATTFVVKGKHGTQRLVVVGTATPAAPHATTQTSPPPP